jgi:hypothetical protein
MAMPRPLTPTCAPDADWHRYDIWNDYDDEDHSLEGSGDDEDY